MVRPLALNNLGTALQDVVHEGRRQGRHRLKWRCMVRMCVRFAISQRLRDRLHSRLVHRTGPRLLGGGLCRWSDCGVCRWFKRHSSLKAVRGDVDTRMRCCLPLVFFTPPSGLGFALGALPGAATGPIADEGLLVLCPSAACRADPSTGQSTSIGCPGCTDDLVTLFPIPWGEIDLDADLLFAGFVGVCAVQREEPPAALERVLLALHRSAVPVAPVDH